MREDEEDRLQDVIDVLQLVVGEELQDKGGHTPIDANEEIHTGQHNICRARDFEHKGGRIHERGDGPPIEKQEESQHRQVGGGYIGLLLEADEDDDN